MGARGKTTMQFRETDEGLLAFASVRDTDDQLPPSDSMDDISLSDGDEDSTPMDVMDASTPPPTSPETPSTPPPTSSDTIDMLRK